MIWTDLLALSFILGTFCLAQRIFWASMVRSWDITDSIQNKWRCTMTIQRRKISSIAFAVTALVSSIILFVFQIELNDAQEDQMVSHLKTQE